MISWTNLSIKEPKGQIQRIEEGQEVNWRFRLFLYEKKRENRFDNKNTSSSSK